MVIPIKKKYIYLSITFVFFTILTYLISDNIFFWDTVQLGSRHAHFFLENNFNSILLPDNIDSGHIPAFGLYLACVWKIFGKTLFVSHFAMLPFIYGIIWQAYILLKKFISEKYVFLALTLFLADATLLSQFTLVSPDVILVFFFLTGLNAVLSNNKLFISLSVIGLFLISMRGMMITVSILIPDIIYNLKLKTFKRSVFLLLRRSIIYLPAFLIFILYTFYHYKVKGWISYHEDSPWQKNFEYASFPGFIRNIGILIWRLLDFGRVFIWIPMIIILTVSFKNIIKDEKVKKLFLIFISIFLCLTVSFLIYRSLTAHRYILPVFLIFSLLASYLIFEKINRVKLKYLIFSFVLIGMLSGNFWIYPKKTAQGWDSTLAHLNYYGLRENMLEYMEENLISIEETGSAFPNTAEFKYLDLSESQERFSEKDINSNRYIFYSNIFNNFSDKEISQLKSEFKEVKLFEQLGVYVVLYKKQPD